jgi:hypothetical protein
MYIVKVVTMGDMSSESLSKAFYDMEDGEPEDIVVGHIGFYSSIEELEDNIDADTYSFEKEYGIAIEDSGCWIEVENDSEEV